MIGVLKFVWEKVGKISFQKMTLEMVPPALLSSLPNQQFLFVWYNVLILPFNLILPYLIKICWDLSSPVHNNGQ
jgi:hypothetical protein